MKIYARQIPPEYQESPLMMGDEFWPDNVIFDGNRDYKSHTIPEYDQIVRYFDDMAGEWENRRFRYTYNAQGWKQAVVHPAPSLAELLHDYGFSRNDGKAWTTKQRHKWRLLLEGDAPGDSDDVILAALELITGQAWESATIRGCCQCDWQYAFYRLADYPEGLDWLETEYFNTGSEWEVHDGNTPPEDPEDISGFGCYCHGWNDDQIKKEIAEAYGEPDAEVVLYRFDGYTKTAKYTEV